MVRTFKNNFEYINFITSNKLLDDEIICSNFLPSAFFPKEIIDYFFDKKEHIDKHKIASDMLWHYGKHILKKLDIGKMQIGIEFNSLKIFLEKGIVHKATHNFETSLAARIYVIDKIILFLDYIYFFPEPIPYIFRLIPNDLVILDVDNNKTEQTIQGIFIKDKQVFDDFKNEFERLKKNSINLINKNNIRKSLIDAKVTLKSGAITKLQI